MAYHPKAISDDTIAIGATITGLLAGIAVVVLVTMMGLSNEASRAADHHKNWSVVVTTPVGPTVLLTNGHVGTYVTYSVDGKPYKNLYDTGDNQSITGDKLLQSYVNNTTGQLWNNGIGAPNFSQYNPAYVFGGVGLGVGIGLAGAAFVGLTCLITNYLYDNREEKRQRKLNVNV